MNMPILPSNASRKTTPSTNSPFDDAQQASSSSQKAACKKPGKQYNQKQCDAKQHNENRGDKKIEAMGDHPADIGFFSQLLHGVEGVTTPQSITPVANAQSEAETMLTANQVVRENQGIQQIRQWADRLWLSAQRDNLILTTSIGSAPVTVKSAVEQGLVNITIYCSDPTFTDKMRAEKRHLDRKPGLQHVKTSIKCQALNQGLYQQPPAYDSSLSSEGDIEEIQV